jgi:hypothetical protein
MMGDVDGDGQSDTLATFGAGFDTGNNQTWDRSYGYVLVYDNTPGAAAPAWTAEAEVTVQGEDWIPFPILRFAFSWGGRVFVDNNRDGFINDAIVGTAKAIFSLSLQYRVLGGPPRLVSASLADFDGNGPDLNDYLILNMDQSVTVTTTLLQPSHFNLPVSGDSVGRTSFRALLNPHNSRQIVLQLGSGAHLTPRGIFSTLRRTPDSPSGIDFATSLPIGAIRGLNGLPVTRGTAVDIAYCLLGQSRNVGASGGTISVANSADAAYTQHQIKIPSASLTTTTTIDLMLPLINLGVPGTFRIRATNPSIRFGRLATITAQYREEDVDWDLGYLESEMRVHQLVEMPLGVFKFIPVQGKQWLGAPTLKHIAGSAQKMDVGASGEVSVNVNSLNPQNSAGTIGVFAGLPIETVDEHTVTMKPGVGGVAKGAGSIELTPGLYGAYTLHKIEFPGYAASNGTESNRINVTIRMATLAERYALAGGQSFPLLSGAVFVVQATDAVDQPVEFSDPVNLTVQFKERPDPAMSDVVHFDGQLALLRNMRVVRDTKLGADVSFAFATGDSQDVNTGQQTVTFLGLTGLTGTDGTGTFGAVAPPGVTPALHWALYP